mmetsp:Transcript_57202/g.114683  ORF Transcript_57202/g.114683 Transcript_57202/m.114683 type:complete len:147 (+) Transcript_57202:50-490(+)
MAVARQRLVLLPALLAALALCALLRSAPRAGFVSPPQPSSLRASAVARRAAEEDTKTEYKLPAPDLNILNRNAKVGQTYDQDKKGNMWAVEDQPVRTDKEELLPAGFAIPLIAVLTISSIIFFAQLTGNDPRFGGGIGDGSLVVGD